MGSYLYAEREALSPSQIRKIQRGPKDPIEQGLKVLGSRVWGLGFGVYRVWGLGFIGFGVYRV